MRGADGREYTFRSVDKDPVSVVPEELRDTWVRGLAQDQIVGCHPVPFYVVDELMEAAGILHTKSRLVTMPDDERLGAYRQKFAGVIGQFLEYPQGRSARNPGFQGAVQILNHDQFYPVMAASPEERSDVRAFLKARLFDLMIGDWDRHRRQWRWAKFEGRDGWQPIPEDRDTAFSRYEGLVLGLARARIPRLQNYDDTYPGMKGLTWQGQEQDRRLLAGVERPLFQEVAAELQSQITDAVIARAVQRLPAEFVEIDGNRLEHDFKGRRDGLRLAADAYYEHLADKVKVHLTAQSEIIDVQRVNGHDVVVRAWLRGTNGERTGAPFYQRTLNGRETDEVQIYLGGGEDRVTTVGRANGIDIRVIGEGAQSVVDDTKGGHTRLSTDGGPGQLLAGPGSHLDERTYVPPPVPADTPWMPPRDWGRDTFVTPWLYYGSDIGALTGAVLDHRTHGFRKDPYASRHTLRAGWAFGESTLRADYRAEFRAENRGWYWGWYGYASGTEASHYFGLGNETSDGGDPAVRLLQGTAEPVLVHAIRGAARLPQRHVLRRSDHQIWLQPTSGREHAAQRGAAVRLRRLRGGRRQRASRARLTGQEDQPGGARPRRIPAARSPRASRGTGLPGGVGRGGDVRLGAGQRGRLPEPVLAESPHAGPPSRRRKGVRTLSLLRGGRTSAAGSEDSARPPETVRSVVCPATVTRATPACTGAPTCASPSRISASSSPVRGACWDSPTPAVYTSTARTRTSGTTATVAGCGSRGSTAPT